MNAAREWHLITGEYPPQTGGVSDYTYSVAAGLAGQGDHVHVWCPPVSAEPKPSAGVTVHRELGRASSQDLRQLSRELDRFPRPRQILVQWVPHAYGFRSMNVGFCLWLWKRARSGDRVDLMVHEASLGFGEGSLRQNVPALVHRLMTAILVRAASRIWMSIPRWEERFRPFAFGKQVPFEWLPIPSNIPVVNDPARVRALRQQYAPAGGLILGNFGMFSASVEQAWKPVLLALETMPFTGRLLLIGTGSDECRVMIQRKSPALAPLVHATGPLTPEDLSCHLSACDLLVQPYLDGVSSRRTSAMAGLSHGKPVITTTGPATEPLWAESRAVALVPLETPSAFVESIKRLSADENERVRMGNAARHLYQERFDIAHVIARLRQVEDRETTCAF
jgi:glycosyltransferase involved in cell wall biosynthesis